LVVIGFVDPAAMLGKGGVRVGDRLVLSKPLGFGTTTTAIKQRRSQTGDIVEVVGWMKRLNKTAAELAVAHALRGATDITGFSLLGHGWEMAQASGVGLRLSISSASRSPAPPASLPGSTFSQAAPAITACTLAPCALCGNR
jgi:selenide, water dikinase